MAEAVAGSLAPVMVSETFASEGVCGSAVAPAIGQKFVTKT